MSYSVRMKTVTILAPVSVRYSSRAMRTARLLSPLLCLLCLLAACAPKPVTPPPPPPPPETKLPARLQTWGPLIQRLEADGFDRKELIDWFSRPQVVFDPSPMRTKLSELLKLGYGTETTRRIQSGLADLGYAPGPSDGRAGDTTRRAIRLFQQLHGLTVDGEPSEALLTAIQADLALPLAQRPVPPKQPPVEEEATPVYKGMLVPKQLAASRAFLRENYSLLQEMQRQYQVPPEIAVAIFTVETRLGEFLGGKNAFVTLASMALSKDFAMVESYFQADRADSEEVAFLKQKARERGDWAYNEFASLLRYAKANEKDPLSMPGSIYGAIGIGQFMPSNALKFGVDGDNDGRVDLFTLRDMVMSFGNYMVAHGWQGDMRDIERRRQVLMRYNRSKRYVNTVLAVAEYLMKNP